MQPGDEAGSQAELMTVVGGWVRWQAAGGEVYIMGSYKLNVHEPAADIDLCCVVPLHISRDDFFTSLYSTLE